MLDIPSLVLEKKEEEKNKLQSNHDNYKSISSTHESIITNIAIIINN